MSANSKSQFMHGTEIPQNENNVLRKTAVYIERASARAISRPYGPPPGSNKLSSGLEVGTQQKMIDAAYEAYRMKGPLNTYLSIRWRGLFAYDNTHFLTSFGGTERIRYIIELVRKWITYRDLPVHYLWSRELTDKCGEHLHLALHLPEEYRDAFACYLEGLLLEPLREQPREPSEITRGEFACSTWSSWHLSAEDKTGKTSRFPGFWLAAYTGKGERSDRWFRGKLVGNDRKPVRGQSYGGSQRDGKYDVEQGVICGTSTRKGRYDISRVLK